MRRSIGEDFVGIATGAGPRQIRLLSPIDAFFEGFGKGRFVTAGCRADVGERACPGVVGKPGRGGRGVPSDLGIDGIGDDLRIEHRWRNVHHVRDVGADDVAEKTRLGKRLPKVCGQFVAQNRMLESTGFEHDVEDDHLVRAGHRRLSDFI